MKKLVILCILLYVWCMGVSECLRRNAYFGRYLHKQLIQNEYRLDSVEQSGNKIILRVVYTGKEEYYKKEQSKHIKNILVEIYQLNSKELLVKMKDEDNRRWEVPNEYPFPHDNIQQWEQEDNSNNNEQQQSEYSIRWVAEPFGLIVSRVQTNEIIFDTTNSNLIYSNNYLEFSTIVPTKQFYGLGQRASTFDYGNGVYTMHNKDQPDRLETGQSGNNQYGFHPVWMSKEKSKNYNIILFRNVNSLDFTVSDELQEKKKLKFQVIGGILEYRFFIGDKNPENVLEMYNRYVGGWYTPGFWAFGKHQCRWGYSSLTRLKEVENEFTKNDLPLDTMWNDLDYMDQKEDFTVNTQAFPLEELDQFLREKRLHYVPLIDAGIKVSGQRPCTEGVSRGIFMKSGVTGQPLVCKVWPGKTHFPDFFHPDATEYWGDMFDTLYQKIKISGIWLDMNEIASFCNGECPYSEDNWGNQYAPDIPYSPGVKSLDHFAPSPSAIHYNNFTYYDTHNTYGLMQTAATHQWFKNRKISQMPLIISRSTSFGSGKYTHNWLGDNKSTWQWLRISIPTIFHLGLFSIPFTGADICGFLGSTTPELCGRWYQVGAFYPFMRNHNVDNGADQEPYLYQQPILDSIRNHIKLRYSLLKYYYSLFIAKRGLGIIFKPLIFEFYSDDNVFEHKVLNEQFLVGPNMMVTPVLYQGTDSVTAYFPKGQWYSLYTGQIIQQAQDEPNRYTIENKFPEMVPVWLREGSIVYRQKTEGILRSRDLNSNFKMIIGLSAVEQGAYGQIMDLEDYNSEDQIYRRCVINNCMLDIHFKQQKENEYTLSISKALGYNQLTFEGFNIQEVQLYGFKLMNFSQVQVTSQQQSLSAKLDKDSKDKIKNYYVKFDKIIEVRDTLDINFKFI